MSVSIVVDKEREREGRHRNILTDIRQDWETQPPSPSAHTASTNFWLKLNRDRERESRVAIFSGGDGDSVSRSTSLLLVHFRSLPYEIWRAKEGRNRKRGDGRGRAGEEREERVLARIIARVITPGSSGAGSHIQQIRRASWSGE